MAYQILDLTLINGSDFKVSFFSCTRVYAIASISCGDSRMRTHNTYVDYNDCRNPMWNRGLCHLALHVPTCSETPFFGHRDVGEVFVPFNDLFVNMTIGGDPNTMSYPVRCYKFIDIKPTVTIASDKRKENQYVKNSRYCEVAMAKAMVHVTAYPQPRVYLMVHHTWCIHQNHMGMCLQHHTCILLRRQCTCTL
ncbi:hypothetical protein ZWY2020_038456 [Hordeum vulgare]|nr:hypothetical protein ZWY2020_038456 [Hordeum vulgare]